MNYSVIYWLIKFQLTANFSLFSVNMKCAPKKKDEHFQNVKECI